MKKLLTFSLALLVMATLSNAAPFGIYPTRKVFTVTVDQNENGFRNRFKTGSSRRWKRLPLVQQ